ncbi:histidine phosphatase family protein [Paenibacillus massiliensis]|uniref:histidine phosphatase family protein n=1 Tax=Paenibacillus massiliensis TaxID=225917 RepID=UPI000470EE78|nr:histidine phosphatase family protein [Paenibacillus massiliensis]
MRDKVELTLVRHGATQWNREKRYLGHTDEPLLAEAHDSLRSLGSWLSAKSFDRIYSSDLRRCLETLECAAPALLLKAIRDERLRELHFGAWEGETYATLKEIPLYRAWIDDPRRFTPPQGESWSSMEARMLSFVDTLRLLCGQVPSVDQMDMQGSTPLVILPSLIPLSVLVVTHGGVIRQLAAMTVAGLDFWDVQVEPGGVVRLELKFTADGIIGSYLGPVELE